jgi:tRNA threonylcarbamoyladenosine biosynthesis protein TsaE
MSFQDLKDKRSCILHSTEETLNLGIEFAKFLTTPTILFLYGNLGSGKTTFSKGFIHQKTKEPLSVITSPTFVYMNLYGDREKVAHFDLYRLKSKNEFFALGFDEVLLNPIYSLVEWPEIIEEFPADHIDLQFSEVNGFRKVELIGGSLA